MLTRDQIIEALHTEPLTGGAFIRDGSYPCEVCAVGAVLRRAGVSDDKMTEAARTLLFQGNADTGAGALEFDGVIANATPYMLLQAASAQIDQGVAPLMVLSRLHESLWGRMPLDVHRIMLAAWVGTNFPPVLPLPLMAHWLQCNFVCTRP